MTQNQQMYVSVSYHCGYSQFVCVCARVFHLRPVWYILLCIIICDPTSRKDAPGSSFELKTYVISLKDIGVTFVSNTLYIFKS